MTYRIVTPRECYSEQPCLILFRGVESGVCRANLPELHRASLAEARQMQHLKPFGADCQFGNCEFRFTIILIALCYF